LCLLAAFPLRQLVAQQAPKCEGDGIAVASFARVQIDIVNENCGSMERIVALVVWHGVADWQLHGGSDTLGLRLLQRRMEALRDSMNRLRNSLGGGSNAQSFWGTVLDRPNRQVALVVGTLAETRTLGSFPLPVTDSVLVILVDQLDGVSATNPRVVGVGQLAPATTEGMFPSQEDLRRMRAGGSTRELDAEGVLRRLLDAFPMARAFLAPL
jgi:hypothetical protein